jgi:hypothetical protein
VLSIVSQALGVGLAQCHKLRQHTLAVAAIDRAVTIGAQELSVLQIWRADLALGDEPKHPALYAGIMASTLADDLHHFRS